MRASLRLTLWLMARFHMNVGNVIGHAETLQSPLPSRAVPVVAVPGACRLPALGHADVPHPAPRPGDAVAGVPVGRGPVWVDIRLLSDAGPVRLRVGASGRQQDAGVDREGVRMAKILTSAGAPGRSRRLASGAARCLLVRLPLPPRGGRSRSRLGARTRGGARVYRRSLRVSHRAGGRRAPGLRAQISLRIARIWTIAA